MPLNIRSEEVNRLADRLAARTRLSKTEAVKRALESELRRVDPRTGEVLERIEMPPGAGVSGLESDGAGRFFCGGGSSGKVRVVRLPK